MLVVTLLFGPSIEQIDISNQKRAREIAECRTLINAVHCVVKREELGIVFPNNNKTLSSLLGPAEEIQQEPAHIPIVCRFGVGGRN